MKNSDLKVGQRINVFDHLLFKDDVTTPLSTTMKPSTIVRLHKEDFLGCGPGAEIDMMELVDVVFDHRPKQISRSHFTSFLREKDLIEIQEKDLIVIQGCDNCKYEKLGFTGTPCGKCSLEGEPKRSNWEPKV